MRRVYLLPNVLTTFSLACGLFVIFRMSIFTPGPAGYPVLFASTLLLLVAGIADTLDGATARLIRAESEFGQIFDSLSDGITFGVAPAVLALKSLNIAPDNRFSIVVSCTAMLFAICGVLRLVRYSVTPTPKKKASKRFFMGLPIPAAACAVVSSTLLLASPQFEEIAFLGDTTRALILAGVMIVLGYLMVSRWNFPGLTLFRFRLWSYHLIFLTVALAIVTFYGILHYFPIVFALLSWGYLGIGWGAAIFTRSGESSPEEVPESSPDP